MIDRVNDTLVVSDLVGRLGTLVNGRRVKESPLLPGDELTVGSTSLLVRYAREASSADAALTRRRSATDCLARPSICRTTNRRL